VLGQKIKSFAEEKGLKFSTIADRAGIPTNTFSAMINGKRRITAEEYFSICEALEVSVTYFYEKQTA